MPLEVRLFFLGILAVLLIPSIIALFYIKKSWRVSAFIIFTNVLVVYMITSPWHAEIIEGWNYKPAFESSETVFDGSVDELCGLDSFQKFAVENSFCKDAYGTYGTYDATWVRYDFEDFHVHYFDTNTFWEEEAYNYEYGFIDGNLDYRVSESPWIWQFDGEKYYWEKRVFSDEEEKFITIEEFFIPPDYTVKTIE